MAVSQSLTLSQSSQSIENNSSQVRILWTSTQSGTSWNGYTRTATYYVSINGGAETSYSVSYTLPKGTTNTILDTTITVPHNADGTGSVSVRTYMDTNISAGVIQKSASLTLATIPRASSMTVPAFTIGSAGTMTISRASSSFTHKIDYWFGSASGTAVATTSNTSVSWTPPLSMLNQIPNSPYGTGTLRLYTYSGSTLIGYKDYSYSATAPASAKPSCSFTTADASGLLATFGKYVQGGSRVTVTTTATQSYGSPITAYNVSVDGKAYTGQSITSDPLVGTGNLTITVTVTDSRGRTSNAATATIAVEPYAAPVVTLNAYRCRADGTADQEGTYMWLNVSAVISSVNGRNSATYSIQYKKSSESSWTTAVLHESGGAMWSPVLSCDVASSYDIKAVCADRLNNVSKSSVIPIAFVLMDFRNTGKGVAFGAVATEDNFTCGMDAKFNNLVYIGGAAIHDFVVAIGETGVWRYIKWDSGLCEAYTVSDPVTLTGYDGPFSLMGGYYTYADLSLPTGVFTRLDCALASGYLGSGIGFADVRLTSTSTIRFHVVGNQNSKTMGVRAIVKGKWK